MYGLMLASVERLEAGPDFVQRLHGLLVTRQRRQLASPWPWLGLGIAILRNSRGDLAGVYRHEHPVPDRQLRPGVRALACLLFVRLLRAPIHASGYGSASSSGGDAREGPVSAWPRRVPPSSRAISAAMPMTAAPASTGNNRSPGNEPGKSA